MKILLAHNYYQQPGGEDEVFSSEARLLEQHGHEVRRFTVHNDAVEAMGRIALARATIWNRDSYDKIRAVCRDFKPEVVHFHNTFPLISPSGYQAARDEGALVVQTLHNYRLLCAGATFYRDGRICEDCLNKKLKTPAVINKCYRGNLAASAVTAAMLTIHGLRGSYHHLVDRYIALSDFARGKYIEGGFPGDKIVVKPNFVDPDSGEGSGDGGYALFVGRLTIEKGIETLLDAWRMLEGKIPLKIVGDGPMREQVERAARDIAGIEYLARKPQTEVAELMGRAMTLIFPSLWYEGMPRTIIESFAKGTPVIASDLGTMKSMIEHGVNGYLFAPQSAPALANCIRDFWRQAKTMRVIRAGARRAFLERYTGSANLEAILHIYRNLRSAAPEPVSPQAALSRCAILPGDERPNPLLPSASRIA